MTMQTARPARTRLQRALEGLPSERNVRLASGMVLFFFALTHFLNHALGIFGVDVMQAVQDVRRAAWRSDVGTVLLAGAGILHVGAAMKSLARRRTFRMPWHEALQIGLGLMIPMWLTAHVVGTRGVHEAVGVDDNYDFILRAIWPGLAWQQSALLVIVWVHGCIGLTHFLRTRPWFPAWRDVLLVVAMLVPILSLAGFVSAGREAENSTKPWVITDAHSMAYVQELFWANTLMMKVAGIALAAVLLRYLLRFRRARVAVTYHDGPKLRVAPGPTLLEISRANGVPHASVCGGRARCSTCRVLVIDGGASLPAPEPQEQSVLARINAPAGVRLACQIRPTGPICVERLIAAEGATARDALADDPYRWGVERQVTLLFADIRGFTALAEKSYPYDVVFLLNRFLTEMSGAIREHGGRVDKYLGDGLMAIFGIDAQPGAGAEAALRASAEMLRRLEALNAEFANALAAPLRIGIGVHSGRAILGRIGGRSDMALTALGDTVNTASRLESATKDFTREGFVCVCVVSDNTLRAARLDIPDAERREIVVRGREEPVTVVAVRSFKGFGPVGKPAPAPKESAASAA